MRDLTRLASRIVMFFMQFYYRLARHSRVSYKAYIDGRTRLAGYNTIQDNVLLAGARIGRGTYICRGSNFTDAEVGAFCSIGRNVRIVNGQHPTRTFVSTHPAFFSPNGQPGFSFVREKRYEDCRYLDRERRVSVEVGADVWIGNNVSLMSGTRIGTGAVIATGAVVVSDVAPYAIVVVYLPGKSGNGSMMSRLLICWLRDGGNVRSMNFGKRRTVSRISDCS